MTTTTADSLLAAFQAHYTELLVFVRRRVRCPSLAADIVQETYVRAATATTDRNVDNPRAFLYRVAGNLAIDHLRREQRRQAIMADGREADVVADARPGADQVLAAKQRVRRLMAIVDELPPKCREVFVLRRFDGLSQAEIADRLEISRNMVEKHLRKALAHCAFRLAEED
ncbi:MAG: RNA polymerase subunit sigma-70 [Rhodospirillaceae bacterium]|nr:RNA polymerase subunit sigma-70 [Rhodospirillaceae bacterium]